MQSVEIQGLDKVTKALEDMPGAVREARAVVFEEMGGELLGAVQQRIGGSGRVAGVQEYQVGSGKGYVAVRAKAKTYLGGYAAGYYAYLWTQMLADDGYQWFVEQGGLTRENGQKFREAILSRGNSSDLAELYRQWRGHDPRIEPMLKNRGLNA